MSIKTPLLRILILIGLITGVGVSAVLAVPAIATDDTYIMNPNTVLTVSAPGLTANDTGFNAATHRIESYDGISQFGGVVTVNADGSFTYDPLPGFKGVDTFIYTVRTDEGSATALVTINVVGETVWFVDDGAAPGGDGTYTNPFNTLAPLNSSATDPDGAGDLIFIFDGTYASGIALEDGQKLVGEGAGLTLTNSGISIPVGSRPVISFATPITLGNNNTVNHVDITATSAAISGANINSAALSNMVVTLNNAIGVSFPNATGTITLTNVSIDGVLGSAGAALAMATGTASITLVNSPINVTGDGYPVYFSGNTGAITFDTDSDIIANTTLGLNVRFMTAGSSTTFAGVSVTASADDAVILTGNNATSTVTFTEGIVANASAADAAAFTAGTGRLRIDGTGSLLTAADGSALLLNGTELTQNATFDSLSSTNSSTAGVAVVDPVGNNDIVVNVSTTITNASTAGINVTSPAPSGFMFTTAVLAATTSGVGINVNNAAVTVTDNTSTLTSTGAAAIVASDAVLNLTFATLASSGGANAVSFTNASGTVTTTGGALSSAAGATNHVVAISGSTLAFTHGGSVAKTTQGLAVSIDGLTNPGSVTFNGTVTGSNASGGISIANSTRPVTFTTLNLGTSGARFATTPVTLSNNTGAVSLGNVSIFTAGAPALNIAYTNASPGTVSSTSGTLDATGAVSALVVNPTAGPQPLALGLASIASPGAGAYGIVINNASGTLTVTGTTTLGAKTTAGVQITNSSLAASFKELDITGAADAVKLTSNTGSFTITGDTAGSTDGAGGSISNITQNAFDLLNVTNITLNDLQVTNTGDHAFVGTGVNGLALDNVDVVNAGDSDNDSALYFAAGFADNLYGTVTIANSSFSQFSENGLYIANALSQTLNLTITASSFTDNITPDECGGVSCSGKGLLIRQSGTTITTVNIDGATFNDIDEAAIDAAIDGASAPRLNFYVRNSTFDPKAFAYGDFETAEAGIRLRVSSGNGIVDFDIVNNQFVQHSGFGEAVIWVEGANAGSNVQGTIINNNINGAPEGSGIVLFPDVGASSSVASLTMIVRVEGNTVTNQAANAFWVNSNSAAAGSTVNIDIALINNRFTTTPNDPNIGAFYDTVYLEGRANNTACYKVTDNWIAPGLGGGFALYMTRTGLGTIYLEGMSGTGDVNAQTYLTGAGNNRNETGAGPASVVSVSTGGTITPNNCNAETLLP